MAGPFDLIGSAAGELVSTGKTVVKAANKNPPKPRTKQQRRDYLNRVVDDVYSGQIDEATGAGQLRAAGFPDSKNPFAQSHGHALGGIPRTVVHAVGTALTPHRTGELAAADLARAQAGVPNAGIVAPGTGLVAQVVGPLAQGAVYGPGGIVSAVTHPGRTGGQVLHHIEHPNAADAAFLGYIGAVGLATTAARLAAAGGAIRAGEGVRAAVARSGAKGGSLLHTPRGEPVRIEVPGQAPKMGEIGPREKGVTVTRPVSRNVLVRPVQRARGKVIQRAVDREARSPRGPGKKTQAALASTVSARTTVAREIRAARRTDLALENANPVALDKLLHGVRGLTPAEHEAITVASIAGDEALTNPAAAAARQIETHRHFAALGGDVAQNERAIADIEAAQRVLENPRPKFKRALALAKQEAQRQEQRLTEAGHLDPETIKGRLDKIAQAYGYPEAQPGSFFISQSAKYLPAEVPPGIASARRSGTAMPPPSPGARVPAIQQTFTAESLARGYRAGPSVIARRGVLVNRLLSVERQYEDLWKIASNRRMSIYDIGIRDTPKIRQELRDFFNELNDRIHTDPAESGTLTADQVRRVSELLQLRDPNALAHKVGSEIPGVRWVDSRYLADLGGAMSGSGILRLADAINNPARITQLYLRPAYILNLLGNLGMNGIAEGVRIFPALRQAAAANRLYGPDLTRWIDGGMGVSLSRSFSVDTGFLGRGSHVLAEAWNTITDMHSRRGAFFSEAARNGFKTKADLERLKNARPGSALEEKRRLIFRVANKNIVDYGSLTPVEQEEIRRIIYFYPWVSRGTIWALRTLVENPGKAFTLFQLGQVGAENAHRSLGKHQPRWVEELGLIPVGGRHGDLVNVINPSSINTPSTAVQAGYALTDTIKALTGQAHGAGLGDILTPAATLLAQASQRGDAGATQRLGLPGLLESLPQVQALRRAGVFGEPSKTYPTTSAEQGYGPLIVGGLAPRGISTEAIGGQAVTEQVAPRDKLAMELDQAAERGVIPQADADRLKAALPNATDKEITALRRKLGPYVRARTTVSDALDRAVEKGQLSAEDAAALKRALPTASDADVRALEARLGR